MNKIKLIIIMIPLLILSNCGLYSLGPFGSCAQWEIYSEEKKITNTFKMDVCSTQFGYPFNYLGRKKISEIQDIVYPKLKAMIDKQPCLDKCVIKKESIQYSYGVAHAPIKANVVCKKDIEFVEKKGRFFMTSFNF